MRDNKNLIVKGLSFDRLNELLEIEKEMCLNGAPEVVIYDHCGNPGIKVRSCNEEVIEMAEAIHGMNEEAKILKDRAIEDSSLIESLKSKVNRLTNTINKQDAQIKSLLAEKNAKKNWFWWF